MAKNLANFDTPLSKCHNRTDAGLEVALPSAFKIIKQLLLVDHYIFMWGSICTAKLFDRPCNWENVQEKENMYKLQGVPFRKKKKG